jgi:7-cyano-7-deazaguanine reductase
MNAPSKELDTFPAPAHVTLVRFASEELTSFCPVTAQPDFYRVEIEYVPDALCVESKSLKLYLWSFRDEQMFAEQLSAMIAQDLVDALQPFSVKVTLLQSIRGGLELTSVAEIGKQEGGRMKAEG